MMRKINEIIVHCTATAEGKNVTVDDIRRFHVNVNKWSDIGYHYVVGLDGTVYEGRNIDKPGAHCKGHNAHSIGVAYVGGVCSDGKTPKDTRTAAQKKSLLQLLATLMKKYPDAKIHSHSDFANKACPSFDATKEYHYLLKAVLLALILTITSCKTTKESMSGKNVETTESVSYSEKQTSESAVSNLSVLMDSVVITIVRDSVPLKIVAHRPVIKSDKSAVKTEAAGNSNIVYDTSTVVTEQKKESEPGHSLKFNYIAGVLLSGIILIVMVKYWKSKY